MLVKLLTFVIEELPDFRKKLVDELVDVESDLYGCHMSDTSLYKIEKRTTNRSLGELGGVDSGRDHSVVVVVFWKVHPPNASSNGFEFSFGEKLDAKSGNAKSSWSSSQSSKPMMNE